MINSKKKGFTIVELVIVIAVVAILAAVLIPTFSSLVKKANVSNDTALVKNLNTALAADVDGQDTMYDALQAAKEFGYDIAKIQAKANGNKILWDSKNDCFVYLDSEKGLVYIPDTKNENPADVDLWVISDEVDETYSTYLYGYEGENTVTTSKGIDASECLALNIIYTGVDAAIIVTNGGSLSVENGSVTHYGVGFVLTISDGAKANYVEKGSFAANSEEIENAGNNNIEYTYVSSASELTAALAEKKSKIALSANIVLESNVNDIPYNFIITSNAEINMNGFNIDITHNIPYSYSGNNFGVIKVNACNVEFSGEGRVSLKTINNNMGWNGGSKVIELQGDANVIINSGVLVEHLGGTDMAYGIDMLNSNGNAQLNINGGFVRSNNYIGIRLFNNNKVSTINLNEGIVSGLSRDIWVQNPSKTCIDSNGIVNISESYNFIVAVQNNYEGTNLPMGRNYYID